MNQEDHRENEVKLVVQFLCDKKKFAMSVCRLCGEERSQLDLVVELNDIASGDWSYIKLIEDLKLENFSEELIERKNIVVWSNFVSSCETCFSPDENHFDLKSHNEAKHKSNEIQFSCSSCSKTFKTINGIMNHVQRHDDQRHLTCAVFFATKYSPIFACYTNMNTCFTLKHPETHLSMSDLWNLHRIHCIVVIVAL
jgi:hypothetical protein